MGHLTALLATTSDAALDWVLGAAASIVFVVLIAIPASALNARERKRRQAEQHSSGT